MPGLKERAKTLVELLDSAYYLYAQRPLHLGREGGEPARGRPRAPRRHRRKARRRFRLVGAERGGGGARACGGDRGKLGQVAQPLRAALTGRATSPGLFDVMAVLGKDETLLRLRDQFKDAPAA